MEKIKKQHDILQRQETENYKGERDFYVKTVARWVYGPLVTKKQIKALYFQTLIFPPHWLEEIKKEAIEKSERMWNYRGIRTIPQAHFWVMVKKAKEG